MAVAHSAEVPFLRMKDGRQCLTDEQLAEDPGLAAFVKRFPRCFTYDPCTHIHVFVSDGGKRKPKKARRKRSK